MNKWQNTMFCTSKIFQWLWTAQEWGPTSLLWLFGPHVLFSKRLFDLALALQVYKWGQRLLYIALVNVHTCIHVQSQAKVAVAFISMYKRQPSCQARNRLEKVMWMHDYESFTTPWLALYPGRVGGEKRPGIDCLRMHDNPQKKPGNSFTLGNCR